MPEWWTALELLLIIVYFPHNINIYRWLSAVDIHSGSHGKGLTPHTCKKYCLTCRIISSLVEEKVNFVVASFCLCLFTFFFGSLISKLMQFQSWQIENPTNLSLAWKVMFWHNSQSVVRLMSVWHYRNSYLGKTGVCVLCN